MSDKNIKNKNENNEKEKMNENINNESKKKRDESNEGGKPKLNFYQKVDKFGDLVFLNLMFVVSCIPVITIGAAVTAMYAYLFKMVDDEEDSLWKGYWGYFKSNFKPATKAWGVLIIIFGIMFGEFYASLAMTGTSALFMTALIGIEAVFLSFILPLLFPLIARYENTTFNYFKNSFLISISNLGTWFYLFFIWFIPILIYATTTKILVYSWYLWLLIYISLFAYASSYQLKKLFKKIEKSN